MTSALFPDLIVNGEHVPHAVIASEAQNHDAPSGKPGIAWRKAAHAMAVRTVLLQEAAHRKVEVNVEERAPGQFETEEEALIRGLLDAHVVVQTPTEDEVHAEWAKDPDRFRSPPLWEVSHILVACDPNDEDARTKARIGADDLLQKALAKPAAFNDLAASTSDCGSRSDGGRLGQMRPGDAVPEFEAALRTMQEGDISSEPILTRHGWHIIRMDALAKGAVLPYDTVRDKIAMAMEKARWAAGAQALVNRLMEKAEITGLPKEVRTDAA